MAEYTRNTQWVCMHVCTLFFYEKLSFNLQCGSISQLSAWSRALRALQSERLGGGALREHR